MTTRNHLPPQAATAEQASRRPNGRYNYAPDEAKTAVVERKKPDGSTDIDSGWATIGEIQHGDQVFVVVYKPDPEQRNGHPGFEKAVPIDAHNALQEAERARAVAQTVRDLARLAASDFALRAPGIISDATPFTEDDISRTLSPEDADVLRRRLAAAMDTRPVDESVVESLTYLRGLVDTSQDRKTPRRMGMGIMSVLDGMVQRGEAPSDDEKLVRLRELAARLQSDNGLYADDIVMREIRDILHGMQ